MGVTCHNGCYTPNHESENEQIRAVLILSALFVCLFWGGVCFQSTVSRINVFFLSCPFCYRGFGEGPPDQRPKEEVQQAEAAVPGPEPTQRPPRLCSGCPVKKKKEKKKTLQWNKDHKAASHAPHTPTQMKTHTHTHASKGIIHTHVVTLCLCASCCFPHRWHVPPTHDPTVISWNTTAAVHIAHISSCLRRKKRETELEAQKAWAWRPGGVERAQSGERSRRDRKGYVMIDWLWCPEKQERDLSVFMYNLHHSPSLKIKAECIMYGLSCQIGTLFFIAMLQTMHSCEIIILSTRCLRPDRFML